MEEHFSQPKRPMGPFFPSKPSEPTDPTGPPGRFFPPPFLPLRAGQASLPSSPVAAPRYPATHQWVMASRPTIDPAFISPHLLGRPASLALGNGRPLTTAFSPPLLIDRRLPTPPYHSYKREMPPLVLTAPTTFLFPPLSKIEWCRRRAPLLLLLHHHRPAITPPPELWWGLKWDPRFLLSLFCSRRWAFMPRSDRRPSFDERAAAPLCPLVRTTAGPWWTMHL
jgi:hypothetical protein